MKATGYGKTRSLEILSAEVAAGRLTMMKWPVPTGGFRNVWMKAGDE